ncbi:MAG: hypothetical protein DYG89_02880 [Caldilinea sp. CFX5]|nr:hypothetical protein [Caldilinea sp. CFX5]
MKNHLTQTLLICTAALSFYILIQITNLALRQPSTELIALAVIATMDARPTAKPMVVEVPVTVEVTRLVPALAQATLPPAQVPVVPQATLAIPPTQTPAPLLPITPTGQGIAAGSAPPVADALLPTSAPLAPQRAAMARAANGQAATISCPPSSTRSYTLIPMEAADTNHPDNLHGDLNLALRGYQPGNALQELVAYSGDVDPGAPQLTGLFADQRRPTISSVHQVRDWRWDCGEHGCAGDWLTNYDVTLMGVATTPGEPVLFPKREAEIYAGGYIAVVLYAEESRLTISYTRDGSVANGYATQLENFCVDPNLLAQYREGNAGGRHQLPGLHKGEVVGVAASGELLIAIRDRGMFMDPRSEHDWWH